LLLVVYQEWLSVIDYVSKSFGGVFRLVFVVMVGSRQFVAIATYKTVGWARLFRYVL